MKKNIPQSVPSVEQLSRELNRIQYKSRFRNIFKSTLYTLITVAAIAVLVATLWLPVLQIYGNSMTPTLHNGDILFTVKTSKLERGDIVAFYYNNKILVKRLICGPGDWFNMDQDGTIYVNSVKIEEPYIQEPAFGETNIQLPYQVPDEKVFVVGDHRSTSVDSRNTAVGCVSEEQIVGKIVFRIWPIRQFGPIN